jgi:hypothetical protein
MTASSTNPLAGTGRLAAILQPYRGATHRSGLAAASGTAEETLVQRTTLGCTERELERNATVGYQNYLLEQLQFWKLDHSELESSLISQFPTLVMTPHRLTTIEHGYYAAGDLQRAAIYRAVYSPRQLFERMVIFWSDHFNIDIHSNNGWWLKPTDDRTVIRRHAMGTFPALLGASAHSPAMLSYLTNDPNDKVDPNENYARELMELHTLGVDGGFTQEDVREVARCFTGWSFQWHHEDNEHGQFRFINEYHDYGQKRVLGRTIPAGRGIEDGQMVLSILARHPKTAEHIATKLAKYFLGYNPPSSLITRLRDIYLQTNGAIRPMLHHLLARQHVENLSEPKVKRPFHLFVSALRCLGAELYTADDVLWALERIGHEPFSWPAPNGYPDSAGYWAANVIGRWNFAAQLLYGKFWDTELDLTGFRPPLTPQQAAQRIRQRLAGVPLKQQTLDAIEGYLTVQEVSRTTIREALSLALSAPEFQHY